MPTVPPSPSSPLAVQQQQIARRQAIAQALTQSAFQQPQGQNVSGHYISPGILGALTPLLSAIAGQKVNEKADSEQTNLLTQASTNRGEELQRLRGMAPNEQIAAALTSSDPQIQAYGADLSRRTPGLKEGLGITGVDPSSAIAALNSGDPTQLKAKPPAPVEVNGQLIDPMTGQVSGDYRTKGGETTSIGGDLYQKMDDGTYKKLDNAPKTSVNVHSPDVIRSLMERENSQALIKDLSGLSGFKGQYERGLASIAAAEKALDEGTLQGALAPGVNLAGEIGASVGIPRSPAALNSQRFEGAILPTILDEVQKLRPASDIDVKFIRDNIGSASKDPSIMKDILKRYRNVLDETASEYTAKRGALSKQLGRETEEYPAIQTGPAKGTKDNPLKLEELSPEQRQQLRQLLGQ